MEPGRGSLSARIELLSVLLIALTAIVTSWSAFEASKWGGEMSIRFNEASTARSESIRASNEANRKMSVDLSLFTEYVRATAAGDPALAGFVAERFPERLAVAVDAWLATEPLTSEDPPASPFDMEEYRLEANEEAARLAAEADDSAEAAREAGQTGDDYTITSVMFATVLLLAALAAKAGSVQVQRWLLIGAAVLFVATAAIVATYPVMV